MPDLAVAETAGDELDHLSFARRKLERFIDVPKRERDGVMIWTAERHSVT